MGNENSSLGQTVLRSWKSMHTLIFSSFFLSMGIILATQYEFINFWFNRILDVGTKPMLLLLNRLNIQFDVKMMHGHLWIKAWHVFIAPSQDNYILSYERYELLLLYRRDSRHSKYFSHWRTSCWTHRLVSNGPMSPFYSTWLIEVKLVKRFLKATPTLTSESQLDESEDCDGRDSLISDSNWWKK